MGFFVAPGCHFKMMTKQKEGYKRGEDNRQKKERKKKKEVKAGGEITVIKDKSHYP